jgi:hypothetical protein
MTSRELVERAKQLLLAPRETLPLTLAESGAAKDVMVPYVVTLAALGPVAGFLSIGLIGQYIPSQTVFNTTVPSMFVRSPVAALLVAIARFGMGLSAWAVLSLLLDRLAPAFGGKRDRAGAFKSAAAMLTPIYLAGALSLLNSAPYLDWLIYVGSIAALAYAVLIGIYAVPLQLSVPEPKATGHTLASLGITVFVTAVLYYVLTAMFLSLAQR